MKKKKIMHLIFLSMIIALMLGMSSQEDTPTTAKEGELYKKIQAFHNENKIEPIDAKVDRVWKAIPGYNGWEVDVEASYKKMKADGKFAENKLVYKETSPNVHLEDLPPEPIYRGNPEKPMVALLINVAWGNEYIPEILNILNQHQTKATFFFDGSWVKKNPDLAQSIQKEGHEIGNHAYSHPDLNQRSREDTIVELKKTNDVIKQTLDIQPQWFAPPSGSFNGVTVQVANQLGMKTILWTADTVDWKKPLPSEMVNRVMSQVGNGSMVLMHPTKPVAQGLDSMITKMKAKGFQLGTVKDLLSEERVQPFQKATD